MEENLHAWLFLCAHAVNKRVTQPLQKNCLHLTATRLSRMYQDTHVHTQTQIAQKAVQESVFNPANMLNGDASALLTVIPDVDGVAIVSEQDVASAGTVPSDREVSCLAVCALWPHRGEILFINLCPSLYMNVKSRQTMGEGHC
jgi:hypothetical protein